MADPKLVAGTPTQNGLIAESDLSYEAPDNTPEWNLKDAESDFINSLLGGEGAEQETPDTGVDEEADESESLIEGDEGVDEQPDAVEPLPDEPEGLEEPEDPKLARGIQRVVHRELAAKEREQAAEKKIAELKLLQQEMAQFGDVKSIKNLAEMFDVDPIGAMKAMGKDPDTTIKLALAQQLGDSAPAELKAFAKEAARNRRIAELEAKLASREQEQLRQEYFNTILTGARQYVDKSVGDSTALKAFPTLTTVAKADPDYARDEIMEEIVSEAKRQAAQDPNGEPLAYMEAAKRVESRLSKLAKLLSVQNGTTANKLDKNGKKPITPPSSKPAAKPLAPPWKKQSSNLEDDGLREALKEYERMEAASKQNRLR